jgi:GcrA cell cycle regulator
MQSFIWAPEHSDALRDCLSRGMSYGQAASAINARFGTEFTRNAAIGRAKRLGLATVSVRKVLPRRRRPGRWGESAPKTPQKNAPQGVVRRITTAAPPPAPQPVRLVKLRCVGIKPRLLAFADLEPGDCRYPYGGERDGEAYAFCGHPRISRSSYCGPHHALTHGLGTVSERMSVPVTLRLVKAA